MQETEKMLAEVGIRLPDILLPNKAVELNKFAVIACDQFTAQQDYWQAVESIVGKAPSTLRITLPEAYLEENNDAKTAQINSNMRKYLSSQVLVNIGKTFVYLCRKTADGVRHGLVAALDLEQYDYSANAKSMIRATEGTIIERLPTRIKIRRDAPLETPHIMVLIDDKSNLLMNYLENRAADFECLYDFELMQGGGHNTGYRVDGSDDIREIAGILKKLKEQGQDNFLFATGDGNHSLAAAKACWQETKQRLTAEEHESHPARYALVEIVNLYDPALKFEPIHRLLYNVDPQQVQQEIGFDAKNPPDAQIMQPRLDEWLKAHPQAKLEYIHGEKECRELGDAPDRLAIVFPPFDRDSLFEVVRKNGAFVRKSFSMGGARDKRYYLECRAIK